MADTLDIPDGAIEFLAQHGWPGAQIRALAGDASFRRYFTVAMPGRSAILMHAPPPQEDAAPFIAVAKWLLGAGFSAPQVHGFDAARGLALIEDFGTNRMREAIADDPSAERAVYALAVDVLRALHARPAMALRDYDMAEYLREVNLFVEWYCPALGLDVDRESWDAIWQGLLAPVIQRQSPPVTVLRDYHAENVMLLDRPGIARFGLLDFQDALAGHCAYDLVSMLQDARRDVAPALEEEMLQRYLDAGAPMPDFRHDYAVLGAQRNTKILGIFTRLWKRDGKVHYTGFQPRVWRYLEHDLAQPALAPLSRWFDANVPAAMRSAAWRDHEA